MPKPKDIAADVVATARSYSVEAHSRGEPITIPGYTLLSIVTDKLNRVLSNVATERRLIVDYTHHVRSEAKAGNEPMSFENFRDEVGKRPGHST